MKDLAREISVHLDSGTSVADLDLPEFASPSKKPHRRVSNRRLAEYRREHALRVAELERAVR